MSWLGECEEINRRQRRYYVPPSSLPIEHRVWAWPHNLKGMLCAREVANIKTDYQKGNAGFRYVKIEETIPHHVVIYGTGGHVIDVVEFRTLSPQEGEIEGWKYNGGLWWKETDWMKFIKWVYRFVHPD